jgi:hypothetical protein
VGKPIPVPVDAVVEPTELDALVDEDVVLVVVLEVVPPAPPVFPESPQARSAAPQVSVAARRSIF